MTTTPYNAPSPAMSKSPDSSISELAADPHTLGHSQIVSPYSSTIQDSLIRIKQENSLRQPTSYHSTPQSPIQMQEMGNAVEVTSPASTSNSFMRPVPAFAPQQSPPNTEAPPAEPDTSQLNSFHPPETSSSYNYSAIFPSIPNSQLPNVLDLQEDARFTSVQHYPGNDVANVSKCTQSRDQGGLSGLGRGTSVGDSSANAVRVQRDGVKPTAKKILSMDGGGVRGFSSLLILDHVMKTLGDILGARLEPWQEFDMVAGTSTGGLIAIMLGRLRMSVAECIEAYKDLSRNIFTPTHQMVNVAGKMVDFLKSKGKFRSEPLEGCVKQILREQELSESALVKDDGLDPPKMFVCAVEGINSDAVVIRSYKSKDYDDLYGVCEIWEAACATSAASTFFEPIKIGDRMYVDGALKQNNPIEKVDEESQGKSRHPQEAIMQALIISELWPSQERLIISVGTGSGPGPNVTGWVGDLLDALAKIVTETEAANDAYRKRNRKMIMENRLFRFNFSHGLSDVGLQEHKAVDKIGAHTATYMKKYDTAREVEQCAIALRQTGQRLGYIAGEG